MGKVIGIISIKGGVGKTTIASSLASDLANNYGKRVMLIDANFSAPNVGLHMDIVEPKKTIHDVISGNSRIINAIHSRYGVDVVPGSYNFNKTLNFLSLKDKISGVRGNYDFIILDSSPSLNDEVLSTILASDHLFVVSTPDYPTLSCSLKAASLAKQRGKPISGLIINKIRDPDYELTLEDIEKTLEIPVVARIGDDKSAVRSIFTRVPLPIYNKNSKISREINKLSASLCDIKEKKSFLSRLFSFNLGKEEVNRQLLRGFYRSSLKK